MEFCRAERKKEWRSRKWGGGQGSKQGQWYERAWECLGSRRLADVVGAEVMYVVLAKVALE